MIAVAVVLFLLAIALFFYDRNWLFFVFLLLLGGFYFTNSDRYFGWTNETVKQGEPIISDGAGYYAYLPQWYIYHTDHFEFLPQIGKTYGSSRFTDNIYFNSAGYARNKYYTGTALSMTPFFVAGHLMAKATAYPDDGYSRPYQFMANMACIAYFLFGCLGLYFLLLRYRIRRSWIALVLLGIGLGTNLSYFVSVLSPYSHVFSFAVVAWLLLFAKRWAEEGNGKFFVLFCLFLGWAAIIRPTNMLVLVFVPFLFPSTRLLWERIRALFGEGKRFLFGGIAAFVLFLAFQLWNTFGQTGTLALNTYDAETFEFLTAPKVMEVLFSWRKGLFVFTPILILMLPGWVVLYRNERRLFWGSLLFFAVFTYITASWWCWWYGGCLGMRPYIDVFAILFLPLAFALQHARWSLKIPMIAAMVLAAWCYQIYEYQMRSNILHYDNMNYEQFSRVFLQTDQRFEWALHLQYDSLPNDGFVRMKQPYFSCKGRPVSMNYRRYLGYSYDDNPEVMIYSDSLENSRYFGAEISGEFRIYQGETNPHFAVSYYKADSVILSRQFFIGPFIPTVNELTPVKVQVYPGLTYAEFDSIRIRFEEGNTYTGVKDLRIKELIFN